MVAIFVISIVIVIAGTVAATRLPTIRVRRRRRLIELFTSAISDRRVAPLPSRRPRFSAAAKRFRHAATLADVRELADYRKARADGSRAPRVAAGGLPLRARPNRPEPA